MTVPARRFVRRRQADGVVTVELLNAKSMNILGSEATQELTAEFRRLSREDDCRVIVLRGTGDKAFIGGADINEMAGLDQGAAEAFIGRLAALCEAVRACPAPVIARLSGWCLGAGLEVAVSCDLRVAGAGVGDRLAQQVGQRIEDARVRDAAGREKKPHVCLPGAAVMTLSSRVEKSGTSEDRLDTAAKLIAHQRRPRPQRPAARGGAHDCPRPAICPPPPG